MIKLNMKTLNRRHEPVLKSLVFAETVAEIPKVAGVEIRMRHITAKDNKELILRVYKKSECKNVCASVMLETWSDDNIPFLIASHLCDPTSVAHLDWFKPRLSQHSVPMGRIRLVY